jgi:glutamate/aspartate transport system substrate-binding protein
MSGRCPGRSRRSRTPARLRSAIARARCRSPISIAGSNRSGTRSTFAARLWKTYPPNSTALEIKIAFTPVMPANRLQKVASGEIDLECGSTTGNVQRRKDVAFSPIFFVAGTKLMVPKSSSISSYRDLAGKTAVVTSGTTNEAALRTLSDKQKLGITIITAPDHAQSLETLVSGKAAAFATDDVLLYGFIATVKNVDDMKVVGEYLSYDPYGLVYRRDDPAFAAVVERAFARMASERRLAELYNKWFLRRLPTGETLNLPMSPQLEEVFRMLGQPE